MTAPEGSTLTYTQHTVAFPANRLHDGDTDRVTVSLDAKGGGTYGDFTWTFTTFDSSRETTKAVKLAVYGDGLSCFLDPRVQPVIQQWRDLSDPDEMTPEQLCEMLREAGVVPSWYMTPTKAPVEPEPVAEVALTKSQLTALLVEAGIDYGIHAYGLTDRTEYIAAYVVDSLRQK